MSRTILAALILAVSLSFSTAASAANYVTTVYACGTNSVLIYLSGGSVLWMYAPDLSTAQFNRMYALSLELLASQKQIGYFNNAGSGSTCGVSGLQEITVLEGTSST